MDKAIPYVINHVNGTLQADTEADSGTEQNGSGDLWRSTLENQALFVSEYTNVVLAQIARNRLLMANQTKQIAAISERILCLMAHTLCRALAIATHARRKNCDRRVFPLPLPSERRYETQTDRRKFMPGYERA